MQVNVAMIDVAAPSPSVHSALMERLIEAGTPIPITALDRLLSAPPNDFSNEPSTVAPRVKRRYL